MALSAPEEILVRELVRLLTSDVPLAKAKRLTGLYALKHQRRLSADAQNLSDQIAYDYRISQHFKK